jgi:hypothetical protein
MQYATVQPIAPGGYGAQPAACPSTAPTYVTLAPSLQYSVVVVPQQQQQQYVASASPQQQPQYVQSVSPPQQQLQQLQQQQLLLPQHRAVMAPPAVQPAASMPVYQLQQFASAPPSPQMCSFGGSMSPMVTPAAATFGGPMQPLAFQPLLDTARAHSPGQGMRVPQFSVSPTAPGVVTPGYVTPGYATPGFATSGCATPQQFAVRQQQQHHHHDPQTQPQLQRPQPQRRPRGPVSLACFAHQTAGECAAGASCRFRHDSAADVRRHRLATAMRPLCHAYMRAAPASAGANHRAPPRTTVRLDLEESVFSLSGQHDDASDSHSDGAAAAAAAAATAPGPEPERMVQYCRAGAECRFAHCATGDMADFLCGICLEDADDFAARTADEAGAAPGNPLAAPRRFPKQHQLAVLSDCDHKFCHGCIRQWVEEKRKGRDADARLLQRALSHEAQGGTLGGFDDGDAEDDDEDVPSCPACRATIRFFLPVYQPLAGADRKEATALEMARLGAMPCNHFRPEELRSCARGADCMHAHRDFYGADMKPQQRRLARSCRNARAHELLVLLFTQADLEDDFAENDYEEDEWM